MKKQELLITLGRRIVKLRTKKNLTQRDLAIACDKNPQSIERVENGKINPSIYYLQEIAQALEVPLKKLFEFD